MNVGILALEEGEKTDILSPPQATASPKAGMKLKACVQWIEHPDGYWLLRNPEDVTFLQMSDRHQAMVEQLGKQPKSALTQSFDN